MKAKDFPDRHAFLRTVTALRKQHTNRETLVAALTNMRRIYLREHGAIDVHSAARKWAESQRG